MRTTRRLLASAVALVLLAVAVTACSPRSAGSGALGPVRIGYVASEDCLPLWVAERDGLFEEAGLDVQFTEFPSAQERDAALAGGQVDAVVGDVVSAARLRGAGTPVRIVTVILGATPEEGRHGVAVKPRNAATSLVDLAGKPVGTSKGTMEEYVLESLMLFAGLGPAQIKVRASTDIPARFDALVAGELEAALLPEPYLSLAEKRGAKVIAEDTRDVNFSQSVLVASERYLDTSDGAAATAKLLQAQTAAAKAIGEDVAASRSLLAERIPALKPLARSYRVSAYPAAQVPTLEDVEMALEWMTRAGLLKDEMLYESLVWTPPAP